jgi:hypothetical protein
MTHLLFTQTEAAGMLGTSPARISYACRTGRYTPQFYHPRQHRFLRMEDIRALAKLFRLPEPDVGEAQCE